MAPGSQSRRHNNYIFNQKHQTENKLEVRQGCQSPKATHSDVLPPARPCLLNIPMVPPTRGEVFECVSLCGTFLNQTSTLVLHVIKQERTDCLCFLSEEKKVASGIKITWNGKMLGARSSTNVPKMRGMRRRTKRSQLNNQMCNSVSQGRRKPLLPWRFQFQEEVSGYVEKKKTKNPAVWGGWAATDYPPILLTMTLVVVCGV